MKGSVNCGVIYKNPVSLKMQSGSPVAAPVKTLKARKSLLTMSNTGPKIVTNTMLGSL